MIAPDTKNWIMLWLPVMKELEEMGLNPCKEAFQRGKIETSEQVYIAIRRAEQKYPEWFEVLKKSLKSLGVTPERRTVW